MLTPHTTNTNYSTHRFSELSTLIKSGAGLHGSTLSGTTGSSVPGSRGPAVQGLYMFGGVGCGKTMLMDLLVAAAPKEFQVGMCGC